jgi:hypothetical protein
MLMPEISPREAERLICSVPVWHHRSEIAPGVITPGNYDRLPALRKFIYPEDLSGLTFWTSDRPMDTSRFLSGVAVPRRP